MEPLLLRDEEPPDDVVVVVRGGEMNSAYVRKAAISSHDEFGIYGISVFAALEVDAMTLCRSEPGLAGYGKVRLSTAGRLRALGFVLLPTLDRPHFDVVLPDLDDDTLDRLELGFDNPIPNPAREGQA